MSPADRIVSAVQDDDLDLARTIASGTRVGVLRQMVVELAQRVPPMEATPAGFLPIISAAATTYDVEVERVRISSERRQEVTRARQVAGYAGYLLGFTYVHMARTLGCHHTSVMNSVARVGENPGLRAVGQRIAREHGWDRNARDAG